MNRKLSKIVGIVFILFLVVFGVYKVDTINQGKEDIKTTFEYLRSDLSVKNYDGLKVYLKTEDGTELSDEQITNFLLNTGLYRTSFYGDSEIPYTYSTSVNFFNPNKGNLTFTFEALDGEKVTNKFEYINTGIDGYFIANDIEECDKKSKQYQFNRDLEDGTTVEYDVGSLENELNSAVKVVQKGEKLYLEIFEEAEDDIKISVANELKDDLSGKGIFEFNNDIMLVSLYFNDVDELDTVGMQIIYFRSIFCAIVTQALNENPDWHLTINYYKDSTKDLVKTEVIR